MNLLLQDPWFIATVDRALAKHRGCLTRRQVKAFRRAMAATFERHPTARAILATERPDLVEACLQSDTLRDPT